MGAKKDLFYFIDDIPDSKLEGGMRERGTIWQDDHQNFRLDNQETIHRYGEPAVYNIQVQVNKQCTITSFVKGRVQGKTFAWILAPVDDPWSAQEIRDELKRSVTGFPLMRPGNKVQ